MQNVYLCSPKRNSKLKQKFMKKIILMMAFFGICHSALADSTQKVTISGSTVEADVTSLSFDGDNVVVAYADGNTQTVDMDELSIVLTYSDNTGVAQLEIDTNNVNGKVYNLEGQYMGNDTKVLSKGIYIVNGKKIVIK